MNNMKTRVVINSHSNPSFEYQKGQTGYIDGYYYDQRAGCIAIVIINESKKIWCIPIGDLDPIIEPPGKESSKMCKDHPIE